MLLEVGGCVATAARCQESQQQLLLCRIAATGQKQRCCSTQRTLGTNLNTQGDCLSRGMVQLALCERAIHSVLLTVSRHWCVALLQSHMQLICCNSLY